MPGIPVHAASTDMTVTMDVSVSLSLDASDPANPVLYGEGKAYGCTEDARTHEVVSVSVPDELVMTTPKGEKPVPEGFRVSLGGTVNARRGCANYEAIKDNGREAEDNQLMLGTLSISIPFTRDFAGYGAGEYSVDIPITVSMSKAYGSYTESLDFTPWNELVLGNSISVTDGKVTSVPRNEAIMEIDPSVTELGLGLFQYSSYGEVTIPPTVTSASKAFEYSPVKAVIFEDGFTAIPAKACYNARQLESVSMPDAVDTINEGAFYYCSSLSDFEFPYSLKTLGNTAFAYCSSLEGLAVHRDLATSASIGMVSPFYNAGLRRISFDEGVTKVPSYFCYNGCSQLVELTLPSTLTQIGTSAFNKATCLEEIVIKSELSNSYSSPFEGSGLKKISFADGVTSIPGYLFDKGCQGVTELDIPASVTKIGGYAFRNATSLKDFTLKNNITLSGSASPFYGSGIESLHFADTVTKIPAHLFDNGSSKLLELDIPARITTVGADAFRGAVSLQKVTVNADITANTGVVGPFRDGDIRKVVISEGVTNIPRYFFAEGVSSLTEISFPSTIKTLETNSFSGCASLESLDIPKSMENLGANSFKDAVSLKTVTVNSELRANAGSGTISAFTGAGIEKVIISGNVSDIPRGLFEDGVSKLTEIVMPGSLRVIESRAFNGCSSLERLWISGAVEDIGASAFAGCTSLKELDIPESVYHIGGNAFQNATSLKRIVIKADVDADPYTSPFKGSGIEEVIFTSNVTEIDAYLFDGGCASMTYLEIPSSVRTIETAAFRGASSLKELVIHANVSASPFCSSFEGSGLETISFDDGVTSIPSYMFKNGCSSLATVNIPATVTEVGYHAFYGDSGTTVRFGGTSAQWEAVSLNEWVPGTVICSDTLTGLSTPAMNLFSLADAGSGIVSGDTLPPDEPMPDSEIGLAGTRDTADNEELPRNESNEDGSDGNVGGTYDADISDGFDESMMVGQIDDPEDQGDYAGQGETVNSPDPAVTSDTDADTRTDANADADENLQEIVGESIGEMPSEGKASSDGQQSTAIEDSPYRGQDSESSADNKPAEDVLLPDKNEAFDDNENDEETEPFDPLDGTSDTDVAETDDAFAQKKYDEDGDEDG